MLCLFSVEFLHILKICGLIGTFVKDAIYNVDIRMIRKLFPKSGLH